MLPWSWTLEAGLCQIWFCCGCGRQCLRRWQTTMLLDHQTSSLRWSTPTRPLPGRLSYKIRGKIWPWIQQTAAEKKWRVLCNCRSCRLHRVNLTVRERKQLCMLSVSREYGRLRRNKVTVLTEVTLTDCTTTYTLADSLWTNAAEILVQQPLPYTKYIYLEYKRVLILKYKYLCTKYEYLHLQYKYTYLKYQYQHLYLKYQYQHLYLKYEYQHLYLKYEYWYLR